MNRLLSFGALAVLLGAASCQRDGEPPSTAAANDGRPPSLSAASKLATPRNDLPGLKNFAKVSDTVWRGEQPTKAGFAHLKSMGVKTIVNLRTSYSDRDDLAGLGLDYVQLDVPPHGFEDHKVLAFLKLATDPDRHPLFVHCKHGADRTGAMVAVYRMLSQSWSRNDALSELPRFGFHRIWVNIRRYVERVDMTDIERRLAETKAPVVERIE